MQLPEELRSAIDQMVENTPQNILRKATESLSQHYREGKVSPFSDEAKRLAYLGARMPATYASIYKVLQQVALTGHVLDLGAGPGTASWALFELFPALERVTLIEKSQEAIALGKKLFENHPSFHKATWIHKSITDPIPKADAQLFLYTFPPHLIHIINIQTIIIILLINFYYFS